MDYQEYKKDFLDELRNDSAINGSDTEEEFISRTLDILMDFDEITDPILTYMGDKKGQRGRIMRIDGYCFDEADHSLVMFISDFQDSYTPDKLTMARVDELYWRLYYFIDEVCNGKITEYFDDSDDVLKIARLIKVRLTPKAEDTTPILKIKFYILTNKELDTKLLSSNLLETTIRKRKGSSKTSKTTKSNKKIKKADFNGMPLEINLWHLERIYEMENSNNNDPIVIDIQNDFPKLNIKGIPCIKGNIGENIDYDAYIAIIPGKLLAEIYIEYGSRVLEGNVRAFLGTSGSKSVNSGIKRTINNEPQNFFTYNNGIATTAADIEIDDSTGELLITKIVDLQIINGGQTTATLAEAILKKTNTELAGIYVPMKVTVIEDRESEDEEGMRHYDKMVKDIANFANSQNKVTASDLFSNDPFHIWMEKQSKKTLAPPIHFAIPTGWYYERSRKRYKQEQLKLRGDELKRFTSKFPKKNIINKEQLAIYLTTMWLRPDIVSKGKNWTIKAFSQKIAKDFQSNKNILTEYFYKKCVCAAIIYRTVDEYLEKNKSSIKKPTDFWYKAGGYKGNIVPYTIAKILSAIPNGYSINFDYIWNNQEVPPAFMREIEIVTKQTNDFIIKSGGIIVTEYCKKQDTWEKYKAIEYTPSMEFFKELVPKEVIEEKEHSQAREKKEDGTLNDFLEIMKKGPYYWQKVLEAGIKHTLFTYAEQTTLNEFIGVIVTGNLPTNNRTGKLSTKAEKMLEVAKNLENKLETEGIKIQNE